MPNVPLLSGRQYRLPSGEVVLARMTLFLGPEAPWYEIAPGGILVDVTGESCALDADDLELVPLQPPRQLPMIVHPPGDL